MARQSGMSTPIFDELLREMAEGTKPPTPPPAPQQPAAGNPPPATTPAPRRRHRAD